MKKHLVTKNNAVGKDFEKIERKEREKGKRYKK